MPTNVRLPAYETRLAAYHAAFADHLRSIVATLPIREGDKVVEMACGDGAYTTWLAERVGRDGAVIAVDISPDYLAVARAAAVRSNVAARIGQVAAPIERLPLAVDAFDLVWCAQSLFSLPDQPAAVRTMASLVRPGGSVAILEDDLMHQVLLPWPVDLELAIRRAEHDVFVAGDRPPETYYVARHLGRMFAEAGLSQVRSRSFAVTRQAPLSAPERTFLVAYLADVEDRVKGRLDPADRDRLARLADPDVDEGMVNRPHLAFTCLDHLTTGARPS